MTTFWMLAGGLVLLVIVMLSVPLLRRAPDAAAEELRQREQNIAIARERLEELRIAHRAGELSDAAFEEARAELELEVLEDAGDAPARAVSAGGRWLLPVVALLVPALAFGLYFELGRPDAVTGGPPAVPEASGSEGHALEAMVAKLAERMREQPDDPRGWMLLGRSYMAMERYPEAVEAYRKARGLVGDEPAVLVPLADALAMAQGGKLAGRPFELLQKAYAKDPDDPTTLWLLGMAWFEQGRPGKALEFWHALRPLLAEDPENASRLAMLIERAEAQLKAEGKPLPQRPAAAAAKTDRAAVAEAGEGGEAAVRVHVELDPALAEQAPPEATLFIYAKAWEGPPMPLAVVRRKAADLPLDVVLDDSMAMMPAMRLSKFDALRIEARISKSGNAIGQPGDLVGSVGPVQPGASVTVRIDRRR